MRLIDANAMREDWLENGENEYVYDTNAVLDSIDAQPTVDAVEVVRCKGCYYYEASNPGHGYCKYFDTLRIDNDYCSSWEERQ